MISNDWKEVSLEDVVDVLGDGLHGTPKYNEEGDYYFINGNNLEGSILISEKTKKVEHEEYLKYKKDLNDRTILVSINGTLGKVAVYNGEKVVLGKSACYFNVKKNYNKQFVKYVMYSKRFKDYLNTHSTGTTIKNMGLKQMRAFKFYIPQLHEQKAIANILSTLDEKIEVNNAINKKLEELAQAIFKQWFVDFEFPNEEGKPYKSSGGVMVESELGMIPKGWKVSTIENLCEANQATKSNKEKWEFVNYLDTSNITKNCIDNIQRLDTNVDKIPSRAKRKIKKNDIVYSTVRPNQYHHGIIKAPVENMLASTGFVVLTSKSSYSNDLIYLWLNQEETTIKLQSIAEQSTSTYPSIKPSDILSMKILVPFDKQLNYLSNIIGTQNNQIWINQQQNQKLSQIRDTLLPKLMSGEIRVSIEKE